MKNPLIGASEMDLSRARDLVDAIVNNKIFVVVNGKNCDCQFLQKGADYISQFTYVLKEWGYVGKSRSSVWNAHLNKYCPNQNISSSLANFMADAKEVGLYNGDRDWSGASWETIWI